MKRVEAMKPVDRGEERENDVTPFMLRDVSVVFPVGR